MALESSQPLLSHPVASVYEDLVRLVDRLFLWFWDGATRAFGNTAGA